MHAHTRVQDLGERILPSEDLTLMEQRGGRAVLGSSFQLEAACAEVTTQLPEATAAPHPVGASEPGETVR